MAKLPGEDAVRRLVRLELRHEFEIAERLLEFAVSIFTTERTVLGGDGVDEFVATVALGLMAKMSKQYRSIIALAGLGLGEDAESLTRMYFESMLAMQFILRRRVSLKEGNRSLPPVPGKPLTTKFRAKLYLANNFFNYRKLVGRLQETVGMKRLIGVATKREVDAEAAAWETEIGAEWTNRLKKRGFAGTSVENLACSMGYQRLYSTLYRLASSGVHAHDGMDFAELVEHNAYAEFKIVPSREGVASALKFASLLLIHAVDIVNQRLGFGMEEAVLRFADEIDQMRADRE